MRARPLASFLIHALCAGGCVDPPSSTGEQNPVSEGDQVNEAGDAIAQRAAVGAVAAGRHAR